MVRNPNNHFECAYKGGGGGDGVLSVRLKMRARIVNKKKCACRHKLAESGFSLQSGPHRKLRDQICLQDRENYN